MLCIWKHIITANYIILVLKLSIPREHPAKVVQRDTLRVNMRVFGVGVCMGKEARMVYKIAVLDDRTQTSYFRLKQSTCVDIVALLPKNYYTVTILSLLSSKWSFQVHFTVSL